MTMTTTMMMMVMIMMKSGEKTTMRTSGSLERDLIESVDVPKGPPNPTS